MRKIERRPLTPEEVRALMAVMPLEWQGMILVAVSTGARLMDIANLKWADLNMRDLLINFRVPKCSTKLVSPMTFELYSFLGSLAKPADPGTPVFPTCFKDAQEGPGKLTARFRWLQRKAGWCRWGSSASGTPSPMR